MSGEPCFPVAWLTQPHAAFGSLRRYIHGDATHRTSQQGGGLAQAALSLRVCLPLRRGRQAVSGFAGSGFPRLAIARPLSGFLG